MKVLVTGRIPDEVRAQLAAAHQVQINPPPNCVNPEVLPVG
jgi:hypothetical protein